MAEWLRRVPAGGEGMILANAAREPGPMSPHDAGCAGMTRTALSVRRARPHDHARRCERLSDIPAWRGDDLIVDATAVREHGGGLSTYATSLIKAWTATFPEDRLVVVAGDPGGARIMSAVAPDVRVSSFGGNRFIARHAFIPALTRTVRPDAIFALVPSVPIVPSAVPIVSVVSTCAAGCTPKSSRSG